MRFARTVLVAAIVARALPAQTTDRPNATAPEAVLTDWFHHVERNELDSLRALLTADFQFVSDGKRMGPDAFVSMIKSLGLHSPRVRLRNVVSHHRGDMAYLVYDRDETIETSDGSRTFPETGSLVLVRGGRGWLIAQWTATSPPTR
jgi:ketosteroid isomerase-like protein